jgi:rubrerythrin
MPSPPPPPPAAQVGSGADQLRLGPYFTDRIPAAELAAEVARAAMEDRVALRDAEHAFYYRAFRAAFPAGLPGHPRFAEWSCVGCGHRLNDAEAKFCRVCGAYPAQ